MEISSFTKVCQKLQSHNVLFLRYVAQQTDEWTKKMTYRGGCLTEKVGKQHSSNYIPLFASNTSCISSSALIYRQRFYKIISQLYIIPNNTLCFVAMLTASLKVNFIISFGQYLQFYCIMI